MLTSEQYVVIVGHDFEGFDLWVCDDNSRVPSILDLFSLDVAEGARDTESAREDTEWAKD